jgi:hypothetical protein
MPPPPDAIPGLVVSHIVLGSSLSEELGWLGASPLGGRGGNLLTGTHIQSLRMLGPLDGVPGSTNCWPPFVSLCPSLYLHWVALTQLADFTLEP